MTLGHRGATPRWQGLNLAFEHVERVGVIVVDVGIDTFPAGLKGRLDHLKVGEIAEQPEWPVLPLEPFAFVRRWGLTARSTSSRRIRLPPLQLEATRPRHWPAYTDATSSAG